MTVIDLDNIVGDDDRAALVICAPTGVLYTAQCGGIACTHPSAEGFYLPIWDLLPTIDECRFGCSNLTKSPKHDRPDLRQRFAEVVDAGLERACAPYSFRLRFDYERLEELQEGWWPLRLTGVLHDVGPLDHRCYYHNGNCD